MAINRFHTRQLRNQFIPTSMQEYAAVPMAMQQQHEMQNMALSQMSDIKYNALDQDKSLILENASNFENQIGQAASDLAQSGITPESNNKIRTLAKDYQDLINGPVKAVNARYNTYREEMAKFDKLLEENPENSNWIQKERAAFMEQVNNTPIEYDEQTGQYKQIGSGDYSAPIDLMDTWLELGSEVVKQGGSGTLRPLTEQEAAALGDDASIMYVEGKYYEVNPDEIFNLYQSKLASDPELMKYLQKYKQHYGQEIGIFPGEDSFYTKEKGFNMDTLLGKTMAASLDAKAMVDLNEGYKVSPTGKAKLTSSKSEYGPGNPIGYLNFSERGNNNIYEVTSQSILTYEERNAHLSDVISQNEMSLANVPSQFVNEQAYEKAYQQAMINAANKNDPASMRNALLEQAKQNGIGGDDALGKAQRVTWAETVMAANEIDVNELSIAETVNSFENNLDKIMTKEQKAFVNNAKNQVKLSVQENMFTEDFLKPLQNARVKKGQRPLTDQQLEIMSETISNLVLNGQYFQDEEGWGDVTVKQIWEDTVKIVSDYFQLPPEQLEKVMPQDTDISIIVFGAIGRSAEEGFEGIYETLGSDVITKLNGGPVQNYQISFDPKDPKVESYLISRENEIKSSRPEESQQVMTSGQMLNNYLNEYAETNDLPDNWRIVETSINAIGIPSTAESDPYTPATFVVEFGEGSDKVTKTIRGNLRNQGPYSETFQAQVDLVAKHVMTNEDATESEKIGAYKAYGIYKANVDEAQVLAKIMPYQNVSDDEAKGIIGEEFDFTYTSSTGMRTPVKFEITKAPYGSLPAEVRIVSINGNDLVSKPMTLSSDHIIAALGRVDLIYGTGNQKEIDQFFE